jgi:hypothetical protein
MTEYTPHQKSLIDKYRDINAEYATWWDCIYDAFRSDMSPIGIDVAKVQFSGFCSQGDGASFTGRITDVKSFMQHHKLTETYPTVMRLLDLGGDIDLRVDQTDWFSHYYHENTVRVFNPHSGGFCHILPTDDPLRAAVVEQWDKDLEAEVTVLAVAATSIIRGHCRDLYSQLEEEHDYLTSDDAVWEAIQSNNLSTEEEA